MKQSCTIAVVMTLAAMGAEAFVVTPPQLGAVRSTYQRPASASKPVFMAQSAQDKVKGGVSEATESTKQKAGNLKNSAGEAKERAGDLGDELKGQAKEVSDKAGSAANIAKDSTKNSAKEIGQDFKNAAGELGQDLKDVGNQAKKTVSGTADQVKGDAKNAANQAGDVVQGKQSGYSNPNHEGEVAKQGDNDPMREKTVEVMGATVDGYGNVVSQKPDSTLNRNPEQGKTEADNEGVPPVFPQAVKDAVGKATDAVAGAASKVRVPPEGVKKQSDQ
jgi:uncharacterized protein YjbJ (UPF0337 family)